MRYKSKQEQPERIFLDIFGVIISLGYKIAHNRTSKPADNMHNHRQNFTRVAGIKHPGNMVNRHCNNCNYFKFIRVKQFVFRHNQHQNNYIIKSRFNQDYLHNSKPCVIFKT